MTHPLISHEIAARTRREDLRANTFAQARNARPTRVAVPRRTTRLPRRTS